MSRFQTAGNAAGSSEGQESPADREDENQGGGLVNLHPPPPTAQFPDGISEKCLREQ